MIAQAGGSPRGRAVRGSRTPTRSWSTPRAIDGMKAYRDDVRAGNGRARSRSGFLQGVVPDLADHRRDRGGGAGAEAAARRARGGADRAAARAFSARSPTSTSRRFDLDKPIADSVITTNGHQLNLEQFLQYCRQDALRETMADYNATSLRSNWSARPTRSPRGWARRWRRSAATAFCSRCQMSAGAPSRKSRTGWCRRCRIAGWCARLTPTSSFATTCSSSERGGGHGAEPDTTIRRRLDRYEPGAPVGVQPRNLGLRRAGLARIPVSPCLLRPAPCRGIHGRGRLGRDADRLRRELGRARPSWADTPNTTRCPASRSRWCRTRRRAKGCIPGPPAIRPALGARTASLAGMLATKAAMQRHGLRGTLRFMGEPAEKVCGSKPVHAAKGYYDGCDAFIATTHTAQHGTSRDPVRRLLERRDYLRDADTRDSGSTSRCCRSGPPPMPSRVVLVRSTRCA